MGCAGSNPLPVGGDAMQAAASNGRAVAADPPPSASLMADADKSCPMVQRVVDSVNIDEVVKKIQDVTGSMENLMDDTQEKLGSLFGKVEQKVDDVEEAVEDKVNDVTSDMPEKPKVHEIILLTVEETRVIPIDVIKSEIPMDGVDSGLKEENNETKEEQIEIKEKDDEIVDNEEEKEEKVEEKEEEKENAEEKEEEKENAEEKEEEKEEEEKAEEKEAEEKAEEKEEEEKEEEKVEENDEKKNDVGEE